MLSQFSVVFTLDTKHSSNTSLQCVRSVRCIWPISRYQSEHLNKGRTSSGSRSWTLHDWGLPPKCNRLNDAGRRQKFIQRNSSNHHYSPNSNEYNNNVTRHKL
eukprot:1732510-Amphidinium_carterae.1